MEIRRGLTDLARRSSTPLAFSLNRSICPQARLRTTSLQALHRPSTRVQPSRTGRPISTTRPSPQQGAAAARKEEDENITAPQDQPPQAEEPETQPPARPAYDPRNRIPAVSERFDFLKRPQQQPRQQRQQQPPQDHQPQRGPSSINEFLATYAPPPNTPMRAPAPLSNNRADASRMIRPSHYEGETTEDTLRVARRVEPDLSPPSFPLDSRLGRTVEVNQARNIDFARALRSLDVRCQHNKIKSTWYSQRYHERPGLRRKRLVSKRWRVKFKNMFVATVRRVDALSRKGW